MDYVEIATGARFTVLALRENAGKIAQLESFISSLLDKEQRRLFDRIWLAANYGPLTNPTQSKALAGTEGLFELKSGSIRVFYFYWGRGTMALTHGFVKRTPRTPRQEIERAERLRKDFLNVFRP